MRKERTRCCRRSIPKALWFQLAAIMLGAGVLACVVPIFIRGVVPNREKEQGMGAVAFTGEINEDADVIIRSNLPQSPVENVTVKSLVRSTSGSQSNMMYGICYTEASGALSQLVIGTCAHMHDGHIVATSTVRYMDKRCCSSNVLRPSCKTPAA